MSEIIRLKRVRYPMPEFIKYALEKHKLFGAYSERPPYQQNDHIGWITRAKRNETKKRLDQMIDKLEKKGSLYEYEVEKSQSLILNI
jgi:hypothetical protein